VSDVARRILLPVVLLLWAATVVPAMQMSFGVRLNGEGGWISGPGWEDRVAALDDNDKGYPLVLYSGWSVSGIMELAFLQMLAVQLEIGYARLGGGYRYEFAGVEFEGTREHEMLYAPLLMKFRYDAGSGRFFLTAGPGMALFIGPVVYTETVDTRGWIRKEDPDLPAMVFVAASAGYEYPLGPGHVFGELRYLRSTTRILETYSSYINSLGFGVGYLFPYR
jgi:hypothetical protein